MDREKKLEILLTKVIHTGCLSCEQYEELESEICQEVDINLVQRQIDFRTHLINLAKETLK